MISAPLTLGDAQPPRRGGFDLKASPTKENASTTTGQTPAGGSEIARLHEAAEAKKNAHEPRFRTRLLALSRLIAGPVFFKQSGHK
jgi:hypothetical protein